MTPATRKIALDRVARRLRITSQSRRIAAARSLSPAQLRRAIWRRVLWVMVEFVEKLFGPRAANRYFWTVPGPSPDWRDVRRRLDRLRNADRADQEHFVARTLECTSDPATVIGLSRHPVSCDRTASWLERAAAGTDDELVGRLEADPLLAGATIGAGDRLLPPELARDLTAWVTDLAKVPDSRLFQVRDSAGTCPAALSSDDGAPRAGDSSSGSRHRLVIAERFDDIEDIALLLPGADRVTLLATSDTFGTADLLAYESWPGVGRITVEHTRSRISRFSQQYIDLHEATVEVAQRVVDRVGAIPGLIEPDVVPGLTLEVADFLFFQALKVRAIETLLADREFDHVVVTIDGHHAHDEYIQLLAGVPGLVDDPRVEIVSISRSSKVRARFWRVVDEIISPTAHRYVQTHYLAQDLVVRKFEDFGADLGRALSSKWPGDRRRVQVVTVDSGAYTPSTSAYVHELGAEFDVKVLQFGGGSAVTDEVDVDRIEVPSGPCRPLAHLLLVRLRQHVHSAAPSDSADVRAVESALSATLPRLSLQALAVPLARMKAISTWMERAQSDGNLPDVAVLTPQRDPSVLAVALIARRHGVPTIALEPHIQDANYCRYIKIASDYYGVMSDYFRHRAADGFAIDSSRSRTIGSPRQIAPPGYDPVLAQRLQRKEFESETGVVLDDGRIALVFFCQPSAWEQVSRVWANILEAARATSSRVLLKTHPEESVSRAAAYIEQAAAAGMSEHVMLLEGDAAAAIALADIVLTAYSSAGIDAAVRQRPVVCVTDGEARYPVDLPAVIGASLVTSVRELVDVIEAFRSDPAGFECRARSLIEREPQFVEGPGDRLRAFVAEVVTLGAAGVRGVSDVPSSLFLDRPHPVYPV